MEKQQHFFSIDEILNASESSGFIICSTNINDPEPDRLKCVFISKTAQHLLGVTDTDHFEIKSFFGEQYSTLDSRKTIDFQTQHKDVWLRIIKSTINESSFLFTVTDVSKEKEIETKLSYLQKLSSEAEETMEFGSWIWDINNARFEWTEGMYRLMGYQAADIPFVKPDSSTFKKNIHPDDVEMITGKLKDVLSYLGTYVLEFRIIAENGEEKHLYVRGHNSTDEVTGNIYSIGTAFNVSTLRKMQEELEQKVSDLNTSNADLEQFAYIASHDLQEPLRKIVSFGERLENKAKDILEADNLLYLTRILNSTRRMQKMINNLLEFSRVTGSINTFEPVDLKEIIKITLSDLEVVIQQKKAVIDVDILPVIDANPTQLSQLFINLISNSLKFTRPGIDPVITIRISDLGKAETQKRNLSVNNRYIKITQKDNGIGFSNEHAGRIFTIFQRLRGRSEYEGAGIGLSVCKKVVEAHQGIIEAFGVPDEGATFEIILPVQQNVISQS